MRLGYRCGEIFLDVCQTGVRRVEEYRRVEESLGPYTWYPFTAGLEGVPKLGPLHSSLGYSASEPHSTFVSS